jgi:hypothetical protein
MNNQTKQCMKQNVKKHLIIKKAVKTTSINNHCINIYE